MTFNLQKAVRFWCHFDLWLGKRKFSTFKGGCFHYSLNCRGSTRSSINFKVRESLWFFQYNLKISGSNSLYFIRYSAVENVQVISRPILIFLCIYVTDLSTVSDTDFRPWRENKKQALGEMSQNVSYRSRSSFESEIYTWKMGTTFFKHEICFCREKRQTETD